MSVNRANGNKSQKQAFLFCRSKYSEVRQQDIGDLLYNTMAPSTKKQKETTRKKQRAGKKHGQTVLIWDPGAVPVGSRLLLRLPKVE